jgi:hypothetical protein
MKILLVVIAILVLSILVVVGWGAALPEKHTARRSRRFTAPPQRVFAAITGPQSWRSDIKESVTYTENGRQFMRETDKYGKKMTYEVVESAPPAHLKRIIADKNLPFGGSWTYDIAAHNGGSELAIVEDGEVYNPVFRFVSRYLIGQTRTMDVYLRDLDAELRR